VGEEREILKKRGRAPPKPLGGGGCAWRDGVGDGGLVLNSTTELGVPHVWKGLFLRDEQLKGEEVAVL